MPEMIIIQFEHIWTIFMNPVAGHYPYTRSILDGYFNPLVFWEYLLTSKEIIFLQGI